MEQNKYGHLLDKYMDDNHVDYGIKQEREQTEQDRYGGLLEHAKPNNKLYDDILNVERTCQSIRQQREDEYERANIRRQERIEREKQEHENRVARNDAFVNDFLEKKEAERKAVEEKRKVAEQEQNMYDSIQRVINSRDKAAAMIARTKAMLAKDKEKRKAHEEKMKWYEEQEKHYRK